MRYAIYLLPRADTALWDFGTAVLGYDSVSGTDVPFPHHHIFAGGAGEALVAEPRRYGFHGTLKAPFALASGTAEADLIAAAHDFAAARRSFIVPGLRVACLKRFCALVPVAGSAALDGLAGDCVRHFERLRAPTSDVDRARRMASPLTERQIAHLDAWGYPHVFEDFRFHMTLTGPLDDARRSEVVAALATLYTPVAGPMVVDAIVIARQISRDARFTVFERIPFAT